MINDLVVGEGWSVTRITSNPGAIRGNHFHRYTTQWTHVLRGSLRVKTKDTNDPDAEVIAGKLLQGQTMVDLPGVAHAWQATRFTECIVVTMGPRSGDKYESDTFRLKEDERLIS
jgi:quercetin dioxygenase-like cupin family protein